MALPRSATVVQHVCMSLSIHPKSYMTACVISATPRRGVHELARLPGFGPLAPVPSGARHQAINSRVDSYVHYQITKI